MGGETRDILEIQKKLDEWSRNVNLLWSKDASNVVSLLNEKCDSVIIDGPWGSGKTMNLVPEIHKEASRRGWFYAELEARSIGGIHRKPEEERKVIFDGVLGQFPKIDAAHTGIVVVDESGALETVEVLQEFLSESEKRGYKKSVIIPAGGNEKVRAEMIVDLQVALSEKGKSNKVYKLERHIIPEKLASEYFVIRQMPKEVIDFVLAVFPMYPNLVSSLGHLKSIDSAIEWWKCSRTDFAYFQRGIDRRDIQLINQKLRSIV